MFLNYEPNCTKPRVSTRKRLKLITNYSKKVELRVTIFISISRAKADAQLLSKTFLAPKPSFPVIDENI